MELLEAFDPGEGVENDVAENVVAVETERYEIDLGSMNQSPIGLPASSVPLPLHCLLTPYSSSLADFLLPDSILFHVVRAEERTCVDDGRKERTEITVPKQSLNPVGVSKGERVSNRGFRRFVNYTSTMANKSQEEPKTAPEPDRWYNLTLGPSFKDESSNKYCTLRYEFKPASVDKSKAGLLRKTKENRVSVEFQNNQIGKPKVTFEGNSEEYKENDAVLFFDGETLRLERLHRAVKQLRHLRMPGESAGAAATSAVVAAPSGPALDPRSSPVGKSVKPASLGRSSFQAVPVEVERIDIGEPENTGIKSGTKRPYDCLNELPIPDAKNEVEEHQDIDITDLFGSESPEDDNKVEEKDNVGFDMNVPQTDEDMVVVDDSGDEVDRGPNAAEAPESQVNAEGRDEQTSSSSSSSGSGSSESGSGSGSGSSSSSDSEGSDEVSVHSI
ncbi:unnamed protein product [Sphenostylis stenocarpa]|uniref:Transcription elongation factor Eaf N-terminal domain-containing protein n=1 Tax=Sphenostylis stenocarpa TaxID=92480 RepID=A0AA86W3L9_9FABA|nr:unnamed protein product [Sphenostylis stenocarpa]